MEPVQFYKQEWTATQSAWLFFYIADDKGDPVTVEAMPEGGPMATWSAHDFASDQGRANDAFRKVLEALNANRT